MPSSSSITITPASTPAHFSAAATLHSKGIATGFLSSLGSRFLTELYSAIAHHAGSVVFVALEKSIDSPVLGFIAGTTDTRSMYRAVLRKNALRFAGALLFRALNPVFMIKCIETLAYGFFSRDSTSANSQVSADVSECALHPELLSIAVSDKAHGKGVGKALIAELDAFFKKTAISEYKVVTFSKDDRSNAFYTACGFELSRQFGHHGNVMNEYEKKVIG